MRDAEIAHRRLRSQRLSGDGCATPEEVVGWLAAVQSQDYGPARWSLGQRCAGIDDAAVERAFADGAVLRTHVLRPTWHFVTPDDIRWMLELTGPRVHLQSGTMYRRLGLDAELRGRSEALLAEALRGGRQRTRKELGEELAAAGFETGGFRLAYHLMSAELNGVVCSGAPRGRQHTYALLEERAPRSRRLDPDEALAELTLRYFTSHGPATVKDFTWWSSLTVADIRRGLEMAGAKLERTEIDGVPYWCGEAEPPRRPAPRAQLLQTYDEYVVGYSQSRKVLDESGALRALTRDEGMFTALAVLDGTAVGRWRRTLRKDAVEIELRHHLPLDEADERALREAAARHGEFLGVPAVLTLQAV
jgi:winged helix DNA-binding protein